MKIKYPFDSAIKSHFLIALGLTIWIFVFLYFTEPLDVSEFGNREKLIYLPIYGLLGGVSYLLFLPFQNLLFKKSKKRWTLLNEMVFLTVFTLVAITLARLFYIYVIMINERNPYPLGYMISDIYLPAIATILPIIIIGRFSFGKYKEKRIENQKIEIKGEGNYEGLRLQINNLISIQSSDNYIEVQHFSGNLVKKTLIRNKLSVIDNEFSELIRIHRSYLINPFHFQTWKTQNGKHLLVLSNNIETPVSKTYLEATKEVLNFTTKQ